jgi:thiamine biosynthesis lipoprotein
VSGEVTRSNARGAGALALSCSLSLAIIGCEGVPERPGAAPGPRAAITAPAGSAATPAATPAAVATPPADAGPLPPASAEPRPVSLRDGAMGTEIQITSYTTPSLDEAAVQPKLRKAFDKIRELEQVMTTWRPDSEVSRVNAAAGKAAVVVGPDTFAVVEKSLWISKASGGVFDISFDAMKGIWSFDENKQEKVPDKKVVESARKLIDYKKIEIDAQKRTIELGEGGMRINLGGIAKGYAVDAAARVLEAEGVAAFFIQAGGDLYVRGRKPGNNPFRVGVRDPRSPNRTDFFAMVEVEDHAFSTAGDYERYFIQGDKRYHHIIDPRTGFPATASRSVTIWAKDGLTADAIDDAVFILGPERGLKLVESIDDCGAVIVDAKNKVWISKRLEGKVHMVHPPTDGI